MPRSSLPRPLTRLPRRYLAAGLIGALAAAPLAAANNQPDNPPRDLMVAGYVEPVQIAGTNLVFKARLDSGATLSSLNALDLEQYEQDGETWVRFDVLDPNDTDERLTLEYPVKRTIRIVQHSGNHQQRPVIELTYCIGEHHRKAEVSLIDRSHFTYQMLVGRNHMRNALLIDPGKRNLHEPKCPGDRASN